MGASSWAAAALPRGSPRQNRQHRKLASLVRGHRIHRVYREVSQLRHFAKMVERKCPSNVVVRDVKVDQLREGLPVCVRQWPLDVVVAQQDVPQLGQVSEGLWDGPF